MKRVQVDRIASPIERLPVSRNAQGREIVQRPGRAVFARNPLRIDDREVARFGRNAFVDREKAVAGARGIDEEGYGLRLRSERRPFDEGLCDQYGGEQHGGSRFEGQFGRSSPSTTTKSLSLFLPSLSKGGRSAT